MAQYLVNIGQFAYCLHSLTYALYLR